LTALRMRIDLSGVLLCHAEDLSEVLGPIEARFEALGPDDDPWDLEQETALSNQELLDLVGGHNIHMLLQLYQHLCQLKGMLDAGHDGGKAVADLFDLYVVPEAHSQLVHCEACDWRGPGVAAMSGSDAGRACPSCSTAIADDQAGEAS